MNEQEEIKDTILEEASELRKSLLDKLFNLNTLLSATYLIMLQLNPKSFDLKLINILPFVTVILILIYQLSQLRMLGFIFHKIEDWKNEDFNNLSLINQSGIYIILISIILTIVEIGYLFTIFLK